MSLKKKLQGFKAKDKQGPLWKGPEVDGITFSLLSHFIADRESFRVEVIDGLRPMDDFNHRLEYGNLWHCCEEAHGRGEDWKQSLNGYYHYLCARYPLKRGEIRHWTMTCMRQFEVYLDYCGGVPFPGQKPLSREEVFSIVYKLPSGSAVLLRGKIDGLNQGEKKSVYVQENKTKGDIDTQDIERNLKYDLQTMMYVIVAQMLLDAQGIKKTVVGVSYNVIRRPFSGGRGNIKRKEARGNTPAETEEQYYQRFVDDYLIKEPEYWFPRWVVPIRQEEIKYFKDATLNPLLEELCDWWSVVPKEVGRGFPVGMIGHWRTPIVYNPRAEGKRHYLDEYHETGSRAGLERASTLFPELEGNGA